MKWQNALVLSSLLILITYWLSPTKLAYTFDKSLEHKWWIEVFVYREPRQGDYILFTPPVINKYTKGKLLVKRIVCSEGQRIQSVGLDYYCDGRYLGRARTEDSKGNPVEPYRVDKVIQKGEYFVMGSNEKSYDSRYMGLIARHNIKKLMIPLARYPRLEFLLKETK